MSTRAPFEPSATTPGSTAASTATRPQCRVGEPPPPPLKPYTEAELFGMWGGETEPLVSILCPTFNHREFIAKTLDGFLGQRTSFPFEVLVRDDASTDGTAEIVQEYARRYPTVVRAIIEPRNTYSQGVNFVPPLASKARGRFIAFCGGDDRWIDPDKLSRQASSLERDSNVVLVSTAAVTARDGQVVGYANYDPERACSQRRFEMTVASTWMIRADRFDLVSKVFDQILCEDLFIQSQADVVGDSLHYDDRITAVYNKHNESIWGGAAGRAANYKTFQIINSWLWIAHYHRSAGNRRMALRQMRAASGTWIDFLKSIGPGEAMMFWFTLTVVSIKRSIRFWRR